VSEPIVVGAAPSDGRDTISVIIPAFEAERVVDAALASVAAQCRPADEVVVVDDGSTDATARRARAWSDRLPVTVIRLEQNVGACLGAGGPRAIAVDASAGRLLALLDVDDVWLPDHLAVMEAAHRDNPGGLVTANHVRWVPSGGIGRHPAAALVPVPAPDRQRLAILAENFGFIGSLFSRELYERAGGFRPVPCEDWDLWIRMIHAGARVTMPEAVTVLYRQSAHSVSADDRLVPGEITLLEELAGSRTGDELAAIERALRARRARLAYLEGLGHASSGDIAAARCSWLRALRTSPSVRRGNSRLGGPVALRAAACLVAPRRMTELRERRLHDLAFALGDRRRS
jgi:GT2 family glycosyltransferase